MRGQMATFRRSVRPYRGLRCGGYYLNSSYFTVRAHRRGGSSLANAWNSPARSIRPRERSGAAPTSLIDVRGWAAGAGRRPLRAYPATRCRPDATGMEPRTTSRRDSIRPGHPRNTGSEIIARETGFSPMYSARIFAAIYFVLAAAARSSRASPKLRPKNPLLNCSPEISKQICNNLFADEIICAQLLVVKGKTLRFTQLFTCILALFSKVSFVRLLLCNKYLNLLVINSYNNYIL